MNDQTPMQEQWDRAVAGGHQERLIERIRELFECAVDARSPKNRPPGKAGLRAEKGYYRLLYLQDDFNKAVDRLHKSASRAVLLDWICVQAILDQLADIPELQSEIEAGIDAALADTVFPS